MNKALHRIACRLAASLALAACAGPAATLGDDPHASGRPIYLRAMKTQLANPRAAVGQLYTGTACQPQGEVIWDETLFRQVSRLLPQIFRADAQRAHYRVPPDSTAKIAAVEAAHPDYVEVDMQVMEINARLCKQEEGISGRTEMQVAWQVHAAGTSAPLYQAVTRGIYDAPLLEKRSEADFFARAFSSALDNLLAQPEFREAVGQPRLH